MSSLTYNGAEVTGLRSSELLAIPVTKRRVNLSVDSQSCLSPSMFGAKEVTFRIGQFCRMPRYPRTNSDDAYDDRCLLVDDGLDSAVVVVDGRNSGHGECITDVTRLLIDANLQTSLTLRFHDVIFQQRSWT